MYIDPEGDCEEEVQYLHCYHCGCNAKPTSSFPERMKRDFGPERRVLRSKVVNKLYDATEIYELECGHWTM